VEDAGSNTDRGAELESFTCLWKIIRRRQLNGDTGIKMVIGSRNLSLETGAFGPGVKDDRVQIGFVDRLAELPSSVSSLAVRKACERRGRTEELRCLYSGQPGR